ncbi:NUDIX hydrolase [Cytobacillus praedii]|uniref:NUDIX hydrolase n=1 Tax=Cytobacillus praedii TaxID=1742358 RepID=UPI002E241679|nr:NUDIX domain-containing protein [Cytobacillus praedii]MED3550778.1 NUDIX domain-containing protein [Cytobacillus praedii]
MQREKKILVGVKGVIVNEGKVLIIKRSKLAHFSGGTWEPVGGKVEFGEDLEEALKREVMEEVGLEIAIEHILYATTFETDPFRQMVIITYLCKSKNTDVTLSSEHEDYCWANANELKQLLPAIIMSDFDKNHVFSLIEHSKLS